MQTDTTWYRSMYVWVALVLVGLGLLGVYRYVGRPRPSQSGDRDRQNIRLQPNASNAQMTDVVLSDPTSHVDKTIRTLSDVYREHYHPVELVNGDVYIIKHFGSSGSSSNSSWTDELWKYAPSGDGKKIYAEPGLDFRVSAEARRIAVFSSDKNQTIIVTDTEGEQGRKFVQTDFPNLPDGNILAPFFWHEHTLWFGAVEGLSLTRIFSLDSVSGSIASYDLADLGVARGDFALDPGSRRLIYSDYHPRLDTGDPAQQTATLYMYDLVNQKKTPLMSAKVDRSFEPAWIDSATVEYNDPSGTGRARVSLSSSGL